jgi:hypothetical protein
MEQSKRIACQFTISCSGVGARLCTPSTLALDRRRRSSADRVTSGQASLHLVSFPSVTSAPKSPQCVVQNATHGAISQHRTRLSGSNWVVSQRLFRGHRRGRQCEGGIKSSGSRSAREKAATGIKSTRRGAPDGPSRYRELCVPGRGCRGRLPGGGGHPTALPLTGLSFE